MSYYRGKWRNIYELLKKGDYLTAFTNIERTRIFHTRITAIRKIHTPLTKLCDQIISLDIKNFREYRDELSAEVARNLVVVRYQSERGLIDRDLASAIISVLMDLDKALKIGDEKRALDESRDVAKKLRLFLDSIIAFHYNSLK